MKYKKLPVTVLITTLNNEDTIRSALESVTWADEILVVDSGSTDKTLKICQEFGARILRHKYEYSAKQKNWAIPKTNHQWLMVVDSDEVVTAELAEEIARFLKSDDLDQYDGFGISRKHFFLGKWLKFGGRYPLHNIRLFRKSCHYEDRDVHAHIILPKNKVKNLKSDMLHYSDRSMQQIIEKFNRYTTYQANYICKLRKNGIKVSWRDIVGDYLAFKSLVKDLWYFVPGSSFYRFLYMYLLRFGFLDGRRGFMIAFMYGLADHVSKAKAKEQIKRGSTWPILNARFEVASIKFINLLSPKNKRVSA